ncbi:MAG: pirin family protein [Nitrososphaeraceae archaeon]
MLIEDLKQLPTFYLERKFEHKDSQGHSGVINAGYVQWMTADSGVIHSEIPEKEFSTKVNSSSQLKIFQTCVSKYKSNNVRVKLFVTLASLIAYRLGLAPLSYD